jgi:Leucine-rich repeat (LRR) protein
MNIEEVRKQSIEQFASLRRKALLEAQQNSPITMAPAAAAGASGGGSSNVELFNFDITANWSLTTPNVVDEASFKTFLESGQDGGGNTSSLTDVVITDFLLEGNRLRCNLFATESMFSEGVYLTALEITQVNLFGEITEYSGLGLGDNLLTSVDNVIWPSTLKYLDLGGNQIVTFDPAQALPSGLQYLTLSNNQIVTFDPSIALPSSLQSLSLEYNQIVTFDPSIALPNSLETLILIDNQIVTFDPSIALPSSLQSLALYNNQIVTFDPSIALPSGLQYLTLSYNQIVTFNPTIALPDSLINLALDSNQMTTAGYTDSEPWANAMSVIPARGYVYTSNNVNPIVGTNLRTILIAKGWIAN